MDEIATEFANWLKQHDVTLAPLLMTAALLVGASVFISLFKKLSKQWLRKIGFACLTRPRRRFRARLPAHCG